MNSPLIVFAVTALVLLNGCNGRSLSSEPDNTIGSGTNGGSSMVVRDFVKVSQALPTEIQQQYGSSIELECEMTGSPPPTIQWIRGNGPLSNIDDIVENNLISESSPNSIARVRSRLNVNHNSVNDRTYTCVGRSGSKIAYTSTTIRSDPNGYKPHNITELLAFGSSTLNGPKKARIVSYYNVLLEGQSTSVVLPCKAVGRPRPEIYWLDANDNIISGMDPRFKMIETGDLLITDLRFSDMGSYTCVARNPVGKDTISTFVYPMRVSLL